MGNAVRKKKGPKVHILKTEIKSWKVTNDIIDLEEIDLLENVVSSNEDIHKIYDI